MEIEVGFQKTEVGVIPNDWGVKKLNQVCSLSKTRINPITSTVNFKCVELEHLSQETGRLLGFSDSNNLKSQKTIFDKGDVLFGKLRPYLKKFLFADFEGVCTTEIWVLKSSNEVVNNWLFYLVQTNRILEAANQTEGTKMPRADWKIVGEKLIPLPPTKAEQNSIATALNDTNALITQLEKLIAKKRNIKQGAMQKLLKPKEGWEVEPVKKIASICTGAKNTQDKIDDGIYPFFVRSPNIEKINSYSYDGEAVLVAGDGVGTGKVIHYFNGKFDIHQRVYKISDFQNRINGFYFYLYFKNNFLNRIMQMTAKSSVDSVRMEMISEMTIPFPSITEQNHIAKILSDMDAEIETLEKNLDKYKMIKQGMMQNLLTGKIRLI